MLLKPYLLLILLHVAALSRAQNNIGNVTASLRQQANTFVFTTSKGQVKIEFCNTEMFRVRYATNIFEANEPWMVAKYDWLPVVIKSTVFKNFIQLETTSLTLKIYNTPFSIDVYDKQGSLLSAESKAGKSGGIFIGENNFGCTKQMQPDEHFFGFGERMDFLDQRSKKLQLNVGRGKGLPHVVGAYNILEANYCPIPFFMSTKGYGIFFHNAFPTRWDMGSTTNDQYSFAADGGEMDYYFMYGPKFKNILNHYTSLTGRSPLLPKFALGLHVGTYSGGTWSYEQFTSDKYVIELARKMRALGIPADLLWLDSTWRIFGEVGGKGATSFEWRETFSDPKGMFDSLYRLKYKMVGLHLRPRFDNGHTIKLLDTAQRLGFTYPEGNKPGEFVNFFDSASVNFWWQHGVKRVADQGAKFLKTDEGSAFGALANESNKVGPSGKDIPKLHNLFPLAYAKAPFEKFQQFNGIRGLNQTREGYAGIQRYPYIFAGDWPSEWQYFAPVIKAGLNIGMSGVGYWAHCMGGFEHAADPELYIRWVQFGMFSPIALVFGMEHPTYKEPWGYGADALRNFKHYDSLRYRLMPYVYSSAYNMYKTGTPIMQALPLQYQDDENVYAIGDQYLFGDDLMICPVTTKGAQSRSIYLPEGNWYDYRSGKLYKGKEYIHVLTPLDSMPIFAKAGAIIPMQPPMNFTGEKAVDEITIEIFPGERSFFDLYEDDGETLDYKNGKFSITRITANFTGNMGEINVPTATGNYKSPGHTYTFKIHVQKGIASVMINGKLLDRQMMNKEEDGWIMEGNDKVLLIKTSQNNLQNVKVKINFKP